LLVYYSLASHTLQIEQKNNRTFLFSDRINSKGEFTSEKTSQQQVLDDIKSMPLSMIIIDNLQRHEEEMISKQSKRDTLEDK
jgi:hypothetical protein